MNSSVTDEIDDAESNEKSHIEEDVVSQASIPSNSDISIKPIDENRFGEGNSSSVESGQVHDQINMSSLALDSSNSNDYEGDLKSVLGQISVSENACEDNLHGLSIESNTDQDGHNIENENPEDADVLDAKIDRINPFNSSGKQTSIQPSPEHNKSTGKFLPLESFGNDEIAGSFIQHGSCSGSAATFEDVAEIVDVEEITSIDHKNNINMLTNQRHNERTNFPSFTPLSPSSSDPWVKVKSETTEENAAPQSSISSNNLPGPEKIPQSISQPNDSICPSEMNLKKAPAIENSVPLNPLVLDIPGPCEPEDLIEGIIFSANYLGTTQLVSNRNPAKNTRMLQAQEAVNRIKAPDGESQPTVEVDLFISTSKIKILNADTQETMMGHTLRSISYIADVGDLLVVMAKRHSSSEEGADGENASRKDPNKRQRIICHVLSSSDSHLIAESIGQCFNVAYQQFLQSNCIEPQNLTQADFNKLLDTQEMYHDDLVHYSKQENVKEIWVEKKKGESMGIAIVESGWGSIIPTVILANLQHGSPIERNGKFSIGDQIMAINSTSLVGLPLLTCHSIIKGLRNQTLVKLNIVSCPPVVSVLIKRPDLKHQLGFSVDNGIICSLMRGGIAERGGVRVGHRIIEINNQSVVATPHDKIVQMLVTSVGEIQMKTMPAAMYRLLTGQEQPIYL